MNIEVEHLEAAQAESEIRPPTRQIEEEAPSIAEDPPAKKKAGIDLDFTNNDTAWRCVEGKAHKIALANLNTLWCLSPPYGAVWEYKWCGVDGSECINLSESKGRWHPHPGEDLKWIDVGLDGTVMGLTHDGNPVEYEWDVPGWRGHWNLLAAGGESMAQIGIGKDAVWAMSDDGMPFQWDPERLCWSIVGPPSAGATQSKISSIKCGADGDTWVLDKNGFAYRYDPEFDWVKVGDMALTQLAVGSRSRVYGIGGVRSYVWKYSATQDRWTHLVTPCPFIEIAAGNDGSVWCIDKQHRVWWLYD